MLWVPQKGIVKTISNLGIVGSAAEGTALVANATPPTDGAVTEIISAAANIQDSWGIFISIMNTGGTVATGQACADILIGGATDDVLIPALICGYGAPVSHFGSTYFFPLHIPQGKRIAATLASGIVSAPGRIAIVLYGGDPPPWRVGRKVTTYGTQVDNARGKAVVPTASGGAASATEMTASTGEDHFAFLPGFQVEADTTIAARSYNIGIGVGASVEDRIGTWLYRAAAVEELTGPLPSMPAFADVPAGSRLTLLASNSAANDGAYGGLIYAIS